MEILRREQDKLHVPQIIWGAFIAFLIVFWLASVYLWLKQEEVDVIKGRR